jgi:hypothetical protein
MKIQKRKELIQMKKFNSHPYANCGVHETENGIALQSYNTIVATIDNDGWLKIYGLYSATTKRHIGWFVKEFANLTYQTAKRLYTDGYRYNIHTGEIAE